MFWLRNKKINFLVHTLYKSPGFIVSNQMEECYTKGIIQEVFHVYLNKFENAVTHLFLVIFGNN